MKRHWFYILIAAVLLSACSPVSHATPSPAMLSKQEASARAAAPAMPTAAAAMGYPAQAVAAAAPTGTFVVAGTAAPAGAGGPAANTDLAYASPGSQLVIKDAQLDILVQDPQAAVNRVTGLASDMGGYIISSMSWYTDGYLYATLRLGIPSARFEAALNGLRQMGLSVLKENAQGQDVTDQYVDMQSRLTNLEATASRVRDFLKAAKSIEESLRISQQLAELEAQIEQVKGQMHYFEGRSAYSTVTVNVIPQYPTPTPPPTATPTLTPTATATLTPTPAWNPGKTLDKAGGVLTRQAQTAADVLIWVVVVAGPWLALFALAFLVIRAIARTVTRRVMPREMPK